MLTITRRSGESFLIYPDYSKISPSTTLGELFGENGCITISVDDANRNRASIHIDAREELTIMRSEIATEFKE